MRNKLFYTVISDSISKVPKTNKCIVLDLDNTLVFSQEKVELVDLNIINNPEYLKLRNRTYNFELTAPGYEETKLMWGVTRPHVTEFLLFCLSYFKVVAIWSAGDKIYVDNIINQLFKYISKKPYLVYAADDTVITRGNKVLKELEVMTKDPKVYGIMTMENTLMIDDNADAFRKNIDNAIMIPFYGPKTIEEMERDDQTLLQLMKWLEKPEVVNSKDVRTLNKDWIFLVEG